MLLWDSPTASYERVTTKPLTAKGVGLPRGVIRGSLSKSLRTHHTSGVNDVHTNSFAPTAAIALTASAGACAVAHDRGAVL